jgi:hypothetical protein
MRSIEASKTRLGHYGPWFCMVNASDPEPSNQLNRLTNEPCGEE